LRTNVTAQQRPLIGVTVGTTMGKGGVFRYTLNRAYVGSLRGAGAEVVLLPTGSPPPAEAILRHLDGILLPGDSDVDPRRYGEDRRPELGGVDPELDQLELSLATWAAERGKPLLGICRGHQVVNVALGGTLYQDIRADNASEHQHAVPIELGHDHLDHWIDIDAESRLGLVVRATSLEVNSSHHQAVKRPADGLRVTATSREDGIVEAMESLDGRILTMQCHLEELAVSHEWGRLLIRAFVQAAATGEPIGAGRGRPTTAAHPS
jgi:putative glutamine amidotransferase